MAALVFLLGAWLALRFVPLPEALLKPRSPGVELLDRSGHPLRVLPGNDELLRRKVAYPEIPQSLIQATLAAEDRRFWEHPGVDWRGSIRAAWQLVKNRRIISGGSTITQQLIKLSEPRRRTFRTKLIEAVKALRLEQAWTKQEILAAYLNRIEYGNGVAGCALASRFYFGKPLQDLTVAESALLAGLPQAPTRLNPVLHLERAKKRQNWILRQMRELGWLDEKEYARATEEALVMTAFKRPFEAPHFVDMLLDQTDLPAAGSVRTTLDLDLNRQAERLLREHLARLQQHAVQNGALVIISNRTGEVLALVGSDNYFNPQAGQVNGAWAARSPGSALKPFTYLLAFEREATPATILADVPTDFATASGLFAPVNFDRRWYGPVSCRMALANSLNMPAVKILSQYGGPQALIDRLQRWGLTTLTESADHYGLGLTIGNAEVRLIELANAYACLARLGEFKPWRLTAGESNSAPPAAITRNAAYLIADILSDNDARSTAFGAESHLRFPFKVACKTGTSSNFRDNWAFGYTPEFTVGVWIGNFDGTPMRKVSGVTGAAPVLHELFLFLQQRYGTTWYKTPAGITNAVVHSLTGKRVGQPPLAPLSEQIEECFIASHLPPLESRTDYDPHGRVILSPEYRGWVESGDNYLVDRITVSGTTKDTMRILFPPPGTILYLDPDLPHHGTRIQLRAEAPLEARWSSETLPCPQESNSVTVPLVKGRHELKLRDPLSGEERSTWIEVKPR